MLVKHTFGTQEKRLGSTEGRGGVHWAKDVVGGKRRSRPRRLLSKGVRIYTHWKDGVVTKTSWNAAAGLSRVKHLARMYKVQATGSEEGAMTIHVSHPWSLTDVERAALRLSENWGTARRSA